MSFSAFGMGALSKLVGNLSDTYGTGDTLREKKRQEARDDYMFNERMGIQARVEGAKAAGLHPLAALGFQAGASAPTVVGADPIPYSHVETGSGKPAPRDPTLDAYNAARTRQAEAEADLSELRTHQAYRDYAAGVHALGSQPGNPPQSPMPTSSANLTSSFGVKPGVKLKPDEVTAGRDGRTAGVHQGVTDVELPGGYTVSVPSDKMAEALEDMDFAKYVLLAMANKDRMGRAIHDSFVGTTGFNPVYMRRHDSTYGDTERLLKRYPPKGAARYPDRMGGGRVGSTFRR